MNSFATTQAFCSLPEFEVSGEFQSGRTHGGPASSTTQRQLVEIARDEGYATGYAAGIERGEIETATRLANSTAEFETRLGREKESWLQDIGARMSGDLTHATAGLAQTLLDQIAEVVLPFVKAQIRDSAYLDIETQLAKVITSQSTVLIEGPADILQHLNEFLNTRGIAATCNGADQPSLRIVVDDTTIVSTVEAWLADLGTRANE